MGRKYIRKDRVGNELYPKTITEQVVNTYGKSQESINKETEKSLSNQNEINADIEKRLTRNTSDFSTLDNKVRGHIDWGDLSQSTRDLIDASGDGTIVNNPDNEDLTSVVENGKNVLKLSDRNDTFGMGYKVLRRGKSFASQVTQENTIYEIRYDFDLGGETAEPIKIPLNCIFKFKGGKLLNGKIKANKSTKIIAGYIQIFENIRLIDFQSTQYLEWYGGFPDSGIDCSALLENILAEYKVSEGYQNGIILNCKIHLNKGIYTFASPIYLFRVVQISLLGEGIHNTVLKYTGTGIDKPFLHIFHCEYSEIGDFQLDCNLNTKDGFVIEDNGDLQERPRTAYNKFKPLYVKNIKNPIGYAYKIGNINEGTFQVSENHFDYLRCTNCFNGLYMTGNQTIDNTIVKFQEDGGYKAKSDDLGQGTTLTFRSGLQNYIYYVLSENKNGIKLIEPTDGGAQMVAIGNYYGENNGQFITTERTINSTSSVRQISIDNAYALVSPKNINQGSDYKIDLTYSMIAIFKTLWLNQNQYCKKIIGSSVPTDIYLATSPQIICTKLGGIDIEYTRLQCSYIIGNEISHSRYFPNPKEVKKIIRINSQQMTPIAFYTNDEEDFEIHQMQDSRREGGISIITNDGERKNVMAFRESGVAVDTLTLNEGNYVPYLSKAKTASNIFRDDKNSIMISYGAEPNWSSKTMGLFALLNDDTMTYSLKSSARGAVFFNGTLNKPLWWNGRNWINSEGLLWTVRNRGTTQERPSGEDIYKGYLYADTEINKIIKWNGITWVDINGNPLDAQKSGTTRPAGVLDGFQFFDESRNIFIWKHGNKWINANGEDCTEPLTV